VLWSGRPERQVPRDGFWVVTPAIAGAVCVIALLFSVLLAVAALPGWQHSAIVVCYSVVLGVGSLLAPRYVLDPCEFVITDRRVIWRRGRSTRWVDRDAISFARIHWHRSVPGVGHLELVRAVPFGPLARSQRVMFHDVRSPDAVLAIVRDGDLGDRPSDSEIPLAERLDLGENVLWGAGPEGSLLGARDLATAALGTCSSAWRPSVCRPDRWCGRCCSSRSRPPSSCSRSWAACWCGGASCARARRAATPSTS
jgi:hypothetical protein